MGLFDSCVKTLANLRTYAHSVPLEFLPDWTIFLDDDSYVFSGRLATALRDTELNPDE